MHDAALLLLGGLMGTIIGCVFVVALFWFGFKTKGDG